jgi:DNA-binding beta-propeller fold protein YncE
MDDEVIQTSPVDLYGSRGVFIVNEGNYLYGNSSLSYYDIDTKEVVSEIFSLANGIPLGDVGYSMAVRNGKGYIVVNNSGCIHVVDVNTLLLIKTITGLTSPRHILFIDDDKALVSDLYGRGVSVIDLQTNEIQGKIKTGGASLPFYQHSTENLIRVGNKVYTNCWSYDSKILEISLETLTVTDSIEVGIQPWAMVKDVDNKIWVVNDGGYAGNPFGHEVPSLMRINTTTNTVELRLNFSSLNDQIGQLATNPAGDSLYFIRNHLYKMHINSTSLPEQPIVSRDGRNFRALSVDPFTGDIYISDAVDFMGEGVVYRCKSSGTPIDTINSGITPTFFCFN